MVRERPGRLGSAREGGARLDLACGSARDGSGWFGSVREGGARLHVACGQVVELPVRLLGAFGHHDRGGQVLVRVALEPLRRARQGRGRGKGRVSEGEGSGRALHTTWQEGPIGSNPIGSNPIGSNQIQSGRLVAATVKPKGGPIVSVVRWSGRASTRFSAGFSIGSIWSDFHRPRCAGRDAARVRDTPRVLDPGFWAPLGFWIPGSGHPSGSGSRVRDTPRVVDPGFGTPLGFWIPHPSGSGSRVVDRGCGGRTDRQPATGSAAASSQSNTVEDSRTYGQTDRRPQAAPL